ncbi:MAG: response regulator [Phycisphaerales bacterium]|jgi:two-component system, sensor histidine kinase and response regulator|nr:response regulator [Phycisphaerales bacterium]
MEILNVLVVDDEPGMRSGIERVLRNVSFTLPDIDKEVSISLTQAEDGEKAMEMIAAQRPDLLLLDHHLPGISGMEILEQVIGDSAQSPEMLAVMITAYASLETAVSATKRGAYDFLAKPFTPQELKATVRKAARHLILQREARRLAEEKRQVRFQFISVLAHELKAPLGAIDGYLNLMQDRVAGDQLDAYDKMIGRCAARLDGMQKLIYDLLDLTRIESGQKNRQIEAVDFRELAEQSIESYTTLAAQRDIAIELYVDSPVPMTIDRGELEIILNNLISNAVKYNCDSGRVDITCDAADGAVTITVSDTGIGMAPEDVEKLFGEFTRIKNSKTQNILGSGLGLSILKKLAQLNGGDVSVTSEIDQGTTFTVTLAQHQPIDEAAE